jgi:hypothetical protein
MPSVLMGGVLPFGVVFVELFFILSSIYQHRCLCVCVCGVCSVRVNACGTDARCVQFFKAVARRLQLPEFALLKLKRHVARARATCRTLESEALAVSSCLNLMHMPQVLLFVWIHGDSAHHPPRYEHADLNRHDLLPIVL